MNNLAIFEFNCNQVRVISINGEPWFVAKDVCEVLEQPNISQVVSRLKEYEKGIHTMDTLGGSQDMTIVSESGLYRLVLTSRKPQSEPFQDWVCQDVIPAIRKTGSYSTAVQPELPKTYLDALKALVASEEEKIQLQAQIEKDAPLVAYAEAVKFSEDSVDFNTYAKMIGTGRTRLFRAMREHGIIMKNSTLPYQKWLDAGYFEVSQEIDTNDGKLIPFALVTGKGQIWLKQRLDYFADIERRAIECISKEVFQMSVFG